VINDIWRYTDGKALVTTDVGQHQMWTAQYFKFNIPGKLITSGGLGTMGFGLPSAIGAKFAQPEAEVWTIVGDGGFQMTQAELSTAAQEGVKVNMPSSITVPGDGAPVAGVLLPAPLLSHAHAQPGFRQDRRSPRADRLEGN
jgi:TPP-dependent 2-oxoacid decarboxylase